MLSGPGRTQAVAKLCLHFLGGPGANTPGPELQTTLKCPRPPAQVTHFKGRLTGLQSPPEVNPAFPMNHGGHSQSSQPTGFGINPSHGRANSNQGSTTRGRCTQPTQGGTAEMPSWGDQGCCATGLYETPYYMWPLYRAHEIEQQCLIHRNRLVKTAKMRRQ